VPRLFLNALSLVNFALLSTQLVKDRSEDFAAARTCARAVVLATSGRTRPAGCHPLQSVMPESNRIDHPPSGP